MQIDLEELGGNITKVTPRGRFDTTGAIASELPLNMLANERLALLVDLSKAEFMSSYGIRVLLKSAKISHGKGGNLVIFCPDPTISKVLHSAGADNLIAVHQTLDAAIAALRSHHADD